MTARQLTGVAYAIVVDDLRGVGMTLDQAISAIREWFAPAPTAAEQAVIDRAAEAERMRKNEEAMKSLAAWGGGIPPVRRKAAPA